MADEDFDFTTAEAADAGKRGGSRGGGGSAGGGGKLVLIVVCLDLAVTGITATKVITQKPPVIAAAPAEGAEDAEEVEVPGPVRPLEALIVNLNEPEGNRFLKVQIDVEVQDEEVLQLLGIDKDTPGPQYRAVKDELLSYLSSLKISDAMGESNKTTIKDEVKKRMTKILGEDSIKHIYFGQFVIQ